jgi:hypothetical protein
MREAAAAETELKAVLLGQAVLAAAVQAALRRGLMEP